MPGTAMDSVLLFSTLEVMPSFPSTITDVLNNFAAFATIFGFSLLGIVVAASKTVHWLVACWRKRSDRTFLGADYEHYLDIALRDGCYSSNAHTSLVSAIRKRKMTTRLTVKLGLAQNLSETLRRRASGSTHLSVGDLVRDSSHRLPLNFIGPRSKKLGIKEFGLLLSGAAPEPSHGEKRGAPFLLLAGAGWGKSLTCLWLTARGSASSSRTTNSWHVLITVDDLASKGAAAGSGGQLSIGSESWLADVICAKAGMTSVSELQRQIVRNDVRRHVNIIVDGLDEFAERLGPARMDAFLASWLIENAAFITSRESYYEASLVAVPALHKHVRIRLDEASKPDRSIFVESVCRRIYGELAELYLEPLQAALRNSNSLDEVAKTPICLMMLTEIAHLTHGPGPLRSVDIYASFTDQLAKRDAERLAGVCSLEQIAKIQRTLAWEISKKIAASESSLAAIDLVDLRRVLLGDGRLSIENLTRIELVILDSPLLRAFRVDVTDSDSLLVSFSHESFLEFQVASLAVRWSRGLEELGEEFFEYLETPGVSVFLKEYLDKLRHNPAAQQKVQQRLLALMERLQERILAATDERNGRVASFALGQTAYYLGMLADDPTACRLEAMLTTERDFWFRRCAAIGLAFGGRDSEFRKLVDEMFDQVQAGDFSLARKNIAVEMGFYRDQNFNRLDPTCENGAVECRRMVTTILREMSLAVETPNWPMCLFNLYYLAFYRPDFQREARTILTQRSRETWAALRKHVASSDPRTRHQVSELKTILLPTATSSLQREATA